MTQQINLLNPSLRKTQDWVSAIPLAFLAAVVMTVLLLGGLWFKSVADERQAEAEAAAKALKQTQDEVLEVSKKIAASKPSQALIDELALTQSKLKARESMMATLAGGSLGNVTGFSEYLRGFARQIPGGIWLSGFLIGSGGADMEIRGRMVTPTALPDYIRRLNTEAVFQGRSFSALTIKRTEVAHNPEPAPAPAPASASAKPSSSAGTPPPKPVLPSVVEFVLLPTAPQDRSKPSEGSGVPAALSSEAELSAKVASAPKPSIVNETLKDKERSPGLQPAPEKK